MTEMKRNRKKSQNTSNKTMSMSSNQYHKRQQPSTKNQHWRIIVKEPSGSSKISLMNNLQD